MESIPIVVIYIDPIRAGIGHALREAYLPARTADFEDLISLLDEEECEA